MPKQKANDKTILKAVNWNLLNNDFTKIFWDQNIRQFWVDEEISLVEDKKQWATLTPDEKDTYEKVLAGLTLLDTEQGGVGIPLIMQHVNDLHAKAVLSFMSAMEQMHAKSYSTIFTTLAPINRINQLFEWVQEDKLLQNKANIIHQKYLDIKDNKSLYMAMSASILLETFLFYSGFFYPLYLAGQGKMIGSGEIINLIIRDESIHGVFIGLLAIDLFKQFSEKEKEKLKDEVIKLMLELLKAEEEYTKMLYKKIGLEKEVLKFIKYNADKALMNLGFDPYFDISEDELNVIVINGLDTETKNHDFFSTKGNGYIKPLNYEELKDEDFDF